MTKFQENGYVTVENLQDRLYRLWTTAEKGNTVLRRDGEWSDAGCHIKTADMDVFKKYFRIYTGDRDRFAWVNAKLKAACEPMGYPFVETKWDDDGVLV